LNTPLLYIYIFISDIEYQRISKQCMIHMQLCNYDILALKFIFQHTDFLFVVVIVITQNFQINLRSDFNQ